MAGRFWIIGSFHVRSRNLFVLVGDLLEGTAEPGDTVRVDLGGVGVSARVAGVEVIDISYDGRQHLGLAIAYDDPEELQVWSDLALSNEEVAIEDAIRSEPPSVQRDGRGGT